MVIISILSFSLQLNLDHAMPTGNEMFSAITVMKVLTLVLTNSLGNYESSFLNAMDKEGRSFVRKLVSFLIKYNLRTTNNKKFLYLQLYWFFINHRHFICRFQRDLAIIQKEINIRNAAIIASNKENDVHEYPYEWLLPVKVLNSISI